MLTLNCPSCGAMLTLRGTPYGVCQYCQSLLARSDVGYESIGKVAEVSDDFSPMQLGTHGYFENKHFTLIGRVRKTWEQGSWSEWCVVFDQLIDGQHYGWLAEAQGDWVMNFEQPVTALQGAPSVSELDTIQPGDQWRIAGKSFEVTDIKQVGCSGAEGELADFDQHNQQLLSVDLHGDNLTFATIEFAAKEISVFTGKFVDYEQCKFQNLRKLDGWN